MKPYEFQEKGVADVLAARAKGHGWIVDYEPGLGKTAVAALSAAALDAGRASNSPYRMLVATPAIVRNAWREQLDIWWPDHPEVGIINGGRARKSGTKSYLAKLAQAYAAPIQVVSYALLDEVDVSGWDFVVFDESHRLKNPGSIQSKLARRIAAANPKAPPILLTGTLMPEDVKDLWHQLHLVQPGKWGSPSGKFPSWWFCNRYSGKVANEHSPLGFDYRGANERNLGELRSKLSRISTRVTKAEVAHLLPPFLIKLTRLEDSHDFETVEEWETKAGGIKEKAVLEWVEDATAQASHVCVLTYRKETAKAYVERLKESRPNVPIFLATGDLDPDRRNRALAEAKEAKRAIVIATMDSIGIGIDMTYCTMAVLAELHWKIDVILQALQRFSRLSSRVPSSVDIMCLVGTIDEMQARGIKKKLDIINAVNGAGFTDKGLVAALETAREPDDKVLAKLAAALESGNYTEDLYGS